MRETYSLFSEYLVAKSGQSGTLISTEVLGIVSFLVKFQDLQFIAWIRY
jgi:hypothetical protein